MCATGQQQSPMHVKDTDDAPSWFGPLEIDYKNVTYYHSGFGENDEKLPVEFALGKLDGKLKAQIDEYTKTTFTLENAYVHSPSEHVIDDWQFDLEIEFVHRDRGYSQKLAALSVFFNEGDHNEWLQDVIDKKELHFEELLDTEEIHLYFFYKGSHTVPPCEEEVYWYLNAEILEASATQLEYFKKKWEMDPNFAKGKGNNRAYVEKGDRDAYHYNSGMHLLYAGLMTALIFW